MIKSGYILLMVVNGFLSGKCPTLSEARQLYKQAADNKTACNNLINNVEGCSSNDPVLTGYQAAATMMMAKYAINPISKLSWFRKGRKLLDNTLAQHPQNTELRFLRFTIQTNAPGMLGYSDQINADKSFLLNAVGGLTDAALQQSICSYLQQSKQVSEEEKKQLGHACKK